MTRHTPYPAVLAAAAVLTAVALSSCTTAEGAAPPTSALSTSSNATTPQTAATSSSITTTVPTQSPAEAAITAAQKLIPEYFVVADRSLQEAGKFNVEEFKTVAISSGLIELQNRYNAISGQQKLKQIGSTRVESMTNPRVDLKLNLKKSPPDVPTVQMDVCVDVSKLNIVDAADKSKIPATRVPRQLWRIGVSNYEYPSAAAWRVSFTDPQGGKSC